LPAEHTAAPHRLSKHRAASSLSRISCGKLRPCHLPVFGIIDRMTYLDSLDQDPRHIDSVRRSTFTRSESRPSSKLRQPSPEVAKALQQARGRLRQAAYRVSLDTKRRPEAAVVGMALLAAVATRTSESGFDPASVAIVSSAFADLVDRGYSRTEIEAVFRRIRKKLMPAPDFGSNENG
jgi:hypothetical protein